MRNARPLDLFLLSGVSAASGVYFSGLTILEGSRTEVAPTLLGLLLGGFVFGLASSMVPTLRRVVLSAAMSALLVGLDAAYVHTLPLVGAPGLVAISLLASSPILLAGAAVLGRSPQPCRLRNGLVMGAGSALIILLSLVAYSMLGYGGLPNILLAEYLVLLVYFVGRLSLTRGRRPGVGVKTMGVFVCALVVPPLLFGCVWAAPTTATPIRHVVIIMLENHSFDNLFGVYPTNNATHPSGIAAMLARPVNLLGFRAPSGLRAVPAGVYSTPDPVEGYIAYHGDWAGGGMDGFAEYSGPQSMLYYNSSQLGVEWDLAMEYALADNYFASALTETTPNRLYSLAGFSPVVNDYGPPPYIPYSESIFAELDAYGVSWGYYVMNPKAGIYPLNFFYGVSAHSAHIHSWDQFLEELGNGTLPAVSWVMPIGGGAEGYSQGPPGSVLTGELWLLYIVSRVEASPIWNTTAIFITYDEGGGYYDQVAPPVFDGVQLGERVPLIVISPYAKEGYVSNTLLTHTSLLAFIDYNWRLPALNRLVLDSNIPLDMFDFNVSRPPINFTALGLPVPPSIYASTYPHPQTLAPLFPARPQIPLTGLPYAHTGSSNTTLKSLSDSVYNPADTPYTPIYDGPPFMAVLYALIVTLAYLEGARRTQQG